MKQKIDQNMIKKSQSMKEAIWFHSDKSDPFSFVINIASFSKQYVYRLTFCTYVAITLAPGGMNVTLLSK